MSARRLRHAALAVSIIALGSMPASADKAPINHIYGPPPGWDKYREIGEAYIRNQMIDPDSAKITWVGRFFKGEHKPFLLPRAYGYIACGSVNAKNRMGGYTGASAFIVVIDYDRVLFGEIDKSTTGIVGTACYEYANQAKFEPLSAEDKGSITSSASPAASSGQLTSATSGLSLRSMPDGAYVSGVAAGSPAALAGLSPGMVVSAVNAIPLSGMGDAMLKIIDAAGPTAALSIVGGRTIKLGAPK
jgi:membrane-associated protease RseP (regulator of RpoE activity)